MARPPDSITYWLRASLAGPPGVASSDPTSTATYRAAMQQFEQLLNAAAETGHAARPLPLYYAVAQAGRAIVAARGGSPATSHGLSVKDADVGEDIFETLVTPETRGWFQSVATATGSGLLQAKVPLGALIASLPELARPLLREDNWGRALFLSPLENRIEPDRTSVDGSGWLEVAVALDPMQANTADQVRSLLSDYPGFAGARLPTVGSSDRVVWTVTAGGPSVVVHLPDDLPGRGAGESFSARFPEYRWLGRRWARPTIAGGNAPSPFMTWWALLLGLSMLARYHPAEWVAALDTSESEDATELERSMDTALDAVPQLVLETLKGDPVLLAPFSTVPPLIY